MMIMIDKCNGKGCPLKDVCHRYTSPKVSDVQNINAPIYYFLNDEFYCEDFWGEQAEIIVYNLEKYFKKIQRVGIEKSNL